MHLCFSRSFTVFIFIFKSLMRFQLIFVFVVREDPAAFFDMWIPHCSSTFRLRKSVDHKCSGYFLTLSSVSLICISVLTLVPYIFVYCSSFVVCIEVILPSNMNYCTIYDSNLKSVFLSNIIRQNHMLVYVPDDLG